MGFPLSPSRYHLSGWAPRDPAYAVQARDSPKYLEAYQVLAKELNICLVPGTLIERHVATNKDGVDETTVEEQVRLYNVAYFISNDGQILGSYRKKNIWHPERPYLTSSGAEPHQVFNTPIGRVGMLICWDLGFPEAFRELIAQGAEVIIIPSYCKNFRFSKQPLSIYIHNTIPPVPPVLTSGR
jgi:predicted amidohydrolase